MKRYRNVEIINEEEEAQEEQTDQKEPAEDKVIVRHGNLMVLKYKGVCW